MRILVTGATGFIGSNLTRILLEKGNEVGVLLRKETNSWRLEGLLDSLSLLRASLTDESSLRKEIKRHSPDCIFHLAAYGAYPSVQKDVGEMIRTNIVGTVNLLNLSAGIPVINCGSSSEYGIKNSSMNESDSCKPENEYGWSKLSQTLYCQRLRIPTLRLFSVYGPWEDPSRLIPKMIRSKIEDSEMSLINSVRDYVHVEDVANAFIAASERYNSIREEIINIGSGKQTNAETILRIVDSLGHKPLKVDWNFKEVQREPSFWVADISKANNLLKWQPQIAFKEGIAQDFEWWKKWITEQTSRRMNCS